MPDELAFVQELEIEINRLRRRASNAVLEPGEPISFTGKETKLLGRAAAALGHDSPETLIRASVLDAARRALADTASRNTHSEDEV